MGTEEGGERGPLPAALPLRRGATGQRARSLLTGVSGPRLSCGLGTQDGPAAGAAGLRRRGLPVPLARASLRGARAQTRAHLLVVPVLFFRIPLKKKKPKKTKNRRSI